VLPWMLLFWPDRGDYLGLSRTTKNPQGLMPCGFSVLLRPCRTV